MQSQNPNSKPQYSSIAKRPAIIVYPKKEQAIILNVIEDLKLNDYVISIGNIVKPQNILFASRISNNRICIYLSSIQLVDFVVQNHNVLTINNSEVSIRRMITPAKRLIISNVCPSIPNHVIENAIKDLGFQLASTVSFVRAGISGSEYSHVLSFRRQVYLHPDDTIELPSTTLVKFEDTYYRIYLSYDNLTCFLCKQPGHIARLCPAVDQNESVIPQSETNSQTTQIELATQTRSDDTSVNERKLIEPTPTRSTSTESLKTPLNQTEKGTKRSPSTISSVSTENLSKGFIPAQLDTPATVSHTTQRKSKKLKKSDSTESLTDILEHTKAIKNIIEADPSAYILTFEQISDFLDNVYGASDIISIARQYTENIPGLIEMLTKIYPHLTSRTMKTRCTNTKKKLFKQLNLDTETDDDNSQLTDNSQTSY